MCMWKNAYYVVGLGGHFGYRPSGAWRVSTRGALGVSQFSAAGAYLIDGAMSHMKHGPVTTNYNRRAEVKN